MRLKGLKRHMQKNICSLKMAKKIWGIGHRHLPGASCVCFFKPKDILDSVRHPEKVFESCSVDKYHTKKNINLKTPLPWRDLWEARWICKVVENRHVGMGHRLFFCVPKTMASIFIMKAMHSLQENICTQPTFGLSPRISLITIVITLLWFNGTTLPF